MNLGARQLGSQNTPCCVGLQHHIQNYHRVFTFSFNLCDGSALPIELEVTILRIAITMKLPLGESQHHRLL
jgi:hypothetical protein